MSREKINVFAPLHAAAGNTRKLFFESDGLNRDVTLMLMFEPPPEAGQLYVDLFPICWKVLKFPAQALGSAKAIFSAKTAFILPGVENGNLVEASSAKPCQTGERCTIKSQDQANYFTDVTPGSEGLIQCVNETGLPATVSIGFLNPTGKKAEPALLWNNIANRSTLSVQITPVLCIYSVGGYKETQLLRGDVQGPVIFEKNLMVLPPISTWTVSIDNMTGEIKILPA